jgi:ferredoxin-nitrite reductase
VPVGLLQTEEARVLARVAETCGSGELRLTIYQNVIIPDIPAERLDEAKELLATAGLKWETSLVRGGSAACTGNRHCKYASSDTKTHTMELVEWLEERIVLDTPINIHTTGCPHSCAQHYIGDIGLLACKVPGATEGETREGYHVFVGGGFGEDRKQLGRQLLKGVPAGPELYGKIESLLRAYLRERSPGETFQQFSTSRGIETLTSYLVA